MPASLSKEFIERLIGINECIKDLKHDNRRGHMSCCLCAPGIGKRGHSEFNCRRYRDPIQVRQRLRQIDHCLACGCSRQSHESDPQGCFLWRILMINRGERCRRCGDIDHVFWTCDGSPHPGSQFKQVQLVGKSNNISAQYDTKIEKNCKEPEVPKQIDPNKCVDKDIESKLEIKTLPKLQPSNTSKSDLLIFEDKIKKLENKFESILNHKIESIMLEMKKMYKTLSQNSARNEPTIESPLHKDPLTQGKCQAIDPLIPDLEMEIFEKNQLITSLEETIERLKLKVKENHQDLDTKLLERDKLIRNLNKELGSLESENRKFTQTRTNEFEDWSHQKQCLEKTVVLKNKDLENVRRIKSIQEKQIEDLIELIAKLFPEMKDIDGDLNNSSVIKILENLIEKQNNIKKELSHEREILKNKEEEIVGLKNHISKFDSQNLEKSLKIKEEQIICLKAHMTQCEEKNVINEKTLKEMERKFKEMQKENDENKLQIDSLRGQLELKNSSFDSLNKQSATLEIVNLKNILKSKEEEINCIKNQIKVEQEKNEQNIHLIDSLKAHLRSLRTDSSTLSKENKQLKEAANELENKLKDKMESLEILNNQFEDSNLREKHDCNGQKMTTVKVAQIFGNNKQNNEDENIEIEEHEDHNDSGNYDYDYDDCDHYEYYEHEDYNEYNEYSEYDDYSPHDGFEEINDEYDPHNDFEEYGFKKDYRNYYYDAEQFTYKEAEYNGSKVFKEGIIVTKNNVAQIKASIQDGSIDIYDVMVTNNKGEKRKIRDMINSLNEEQKKEINFVMEDDENILETLILLNIVESDKYLCQLFG